MIGQANSVRHIGLDLSRSSESDTVTKRRLVRAYMCVIYTHIYIILVTAFKITYFTRLVLNRD